MWHEPRVLMLGAQEKEAGKTELSQRILSHFDHLDLALSALKVTVFRGKETEWGYKVWEELDPHREKDTGRLLKAGAVRVLWLKCDEFHLTEGLEAAFKVLPPGPVLCDSNSARQAIRPGLFLMIRGHDGKGEIKVSSQPVVNLADKMVVSEQKGGVMGFTPDPLNHLTFREGVWSWL